MDKKKIEYKMLKKIELMSRRNAKAASSDPEAPWPICPYIFHQPKRPKK